MIELMTTMSLHTMSVIGFGIDSETKAYAHSRHKEGQGNGNFYAHSRHRRIKTEQVRQTRGNSYIAGKATALAPGAATPTRRDSTQKLFAGRGRPHMRDVFISGFASTNPDTQRATRKSEQRQRRRSTAKPNAAATSIRIRAIGEARLNRQGKPAGNSYIAGKATALAPWGAQRRSFLQGRERPHMRGERATRKSRGNSKGNGVGVLCMPEYSVLRSALAS
jgi:hypothetical protein